MTVLYCCDKPHRRYGHLSEITPSNMYLRLIRHTQAFTYIHTHEHTQSTV